MLAQVQNLREFVIRDLAGVIDWSRDVRDDPDQKSTTDHAAVMIKTPFNTYRLTCRSTYIEPPAGAPATCKSLGTVTFDDPAGDKHVVGPKADNTYGEIAKHIRVRELADALAIARREAAEAPAEKAAAARAKLVDVATRAQKAGVKVRDEDLRGPASEDVAAPVLHGSAAFYAAAAATAPYEPGEPYNHEKEVVAQAVVNRQLLDRLAASKATSTDLAPYIGCPVVFVTNPGEAIGGMTEIPGFCSKLQPGGRISMFIMPDNSEVTFRDNLPRRGSDAGDGKVHRSNCWDFNPEHLRLVNRIRHLEEAIGKNADEGNADRRDYAAEISDLRERAAADRGAADATDRTLHRLGETVTALAARLDALEAKPKRGRSAKDTGMGASEEELREAMKLRGEPAADTGE